MNDPLGFYQAVGLGQRVWIHPAKKSDSYVLATVWALLCTLALLAVLVLALASVSAPSSH
jgi:hypothetical protein